MSYKTLMKRLDKLQDRGIIFRDTLDGLYFDQLLLISMECHTGSFSQELKGRTLASLEDCIFSIGESGRFTQAFECAEVYRKFEQEYVNPVRAGN